MYLNAHFFSSYIMGDSEADGTIQQYKYLPGPINHDFLHIMSIVMLEYAAFQVSNCSF